MRVSAWIMFGFLVILGGCAKSNMGHVSGKIEVDGVPLDEGSVTFKPLDNNAPTAGSRVRHGQYSADVPIGKMKVAISQGKVVGKKKAYATADSPVVPITKEALPARFNEKTELRYEVEPGSHEKDFILSTK
jgi:hypothetical protein